MPPLSWTNLFPLSYRMLYHINFLEMEDKYMKLVDILRYTDIF